MSDDRNYRVVLYQEGPQWIAQCVDLDIASQADSMKEVLHRFDVAFSANVAHCEILGVDPETEIGPAPAQFEKIWTAGEMKVTPKTPLKAPVDVVLREAA